MRRFRSGFTLIEVLVTMVVIAVIAGLAMLAVGGNEARAMRNEAERLRQVINSAADEALFTGREYGLVVATREYRVVRYDAASDQWQPLDEDRVFAAHTMPGYAELVLEVDDQVADLADTLAQQQAHRRDSRSDDQEEAGPTAQPGILLLSSGQVTPFTLRLLAPGMAEVPELVVRSDGAGAIQWESADG